MHPPFLDDEEQDVVFEPVKLGRSGAWLVLPIVLIVAVVGFGFIGAHLGNAPAPSPQSTAPAVAETTPAPPQPTPQARAFFGGPLVVASPDPLLPGFTKLVPGGSAIQVALPAGISSPSLATLGRELFYIVDGIRLESIPLVSGASETTLVTVPPCHEIDQLALAGGSLLYDVVSPIGLPPHDTDCGNSSRFGWAIWKYDLETHEQSTLATGATDMPESWDTTPLVHLAASATAFAFERDPKTQPNATVPVEVHSLDGRLLWTTTASSTVYKLMLSGSRLAALTSDGLAVADPASHALRTIAQPAGDAALSQDGRYLVWEGLDRYSPSRLLVTLKDLQANTTATLASAAEGDTTEAPGPTVSIAPGGPQVAWSARLADGTIAPAFIDPSHPGGAVFESPQFPAWIGFTNDDLVWVVAHLDQSAEAFVVDLPSAQPATP